MKVRTDSYLEFAFSVFGGYCIVAALLSFLLLFIVDYSESGQILGGLVLVSPVYLLVVIGALRLLSTGASADITSNEAIVGRPANLRLAAKSIRWILVTRASSKDHYSIVFKVQRIGFSPGVPWVRIPGLKDDEIRLQSLSALVSLIQPKG